MKYLKEARKKERNENYRHLVGERRRRVHERTAEVIENGGSRLEIKSLVIDELTEGQVTPELEWYAEGFARGLFRDGSAYTVHETEIAERADANKHNHLGYSAGMSLERALARAEH